MRLLRYFNLGLYIVAMGLFLCQKGKVQAALEEKFDLTLQASCLPENLTEAPSQVDILIQFRGTQTNPAQGRMIESSGTVSYPRSSEPTLLENSIHLSLIFPGFKVALKRFCTPPLLEGQQKFALQGKYNHSSPHSLISFITPSLGERKVEQGTPSKFCEADGTKKGPKEHEVEFGRDTLNPYELKLIRNISIGAPMEDEIEIGLGVIKIDKDDKEVP